MPQSTAYIHIQGFPAGQYTWYFTGVTAITHNLSLNITTDSSYGTDRINGAQNAPDVVTLSVIETDAARMPGWSAAMLAAMRSLKKNRWLLKLVTSMDTYRDMLLSDVRVTQDEENQYGWSGDLVFTQYIPVAAAGATKSFNNSSTTTNTGSTDARSVSGAALGLLLRRAGING